MAKLFKQLTAMLMATIIVITTSYNAYALSPGGWTVDIANAVGKSVQMTASKAGGAVSTITKTPATKSLAKGLLTRTPYGLLATTVLAILGPEIVDWWLDEEEGVIKYRVPEGTLEYCYRSNDCFNSPQALFAWYSDWNYKPPTYTNPVYKSIDLDVAEIPPSTTRTCHYATMFYSVDYYFKSSAKEVDKTLEENTQIEVCTVPEGQERELELEEVAEKIKQLADAGDKEAQDFIVDTALDDANGGAYDADFDANATTNPSEPETGDCSTGYVKNSAGECVPELVEEETPTKDEPVSPDFPDFCTWAKPVCDFFEESEPEDTELDIPDDMPDPANTDINFGGSCPAPFAYSGTWFGNPIDITLLDTPKLCEFLGTYVKYPVYAVSSLWALYIYRGQGE